MNRIDEPALIVEYTDPYEGFKGYLVIHSLDHKLCAGGFRVQAGVRREHFYAMAKNMALKMRIAGLRVDGAKSGIDYDPSSPGKRKAIGRFLKAIQPYVERYYSLGPDLNVEMGELEEICREIDIPSPKIAIAHGQDLELSYFLERYDVLNCLYKGRSIGSLRAGAGVAQAALSVLKYLNIPAAQATVAIQGFGTLAKATARFLADAGVAIIGIADCDKSIMSRNKDHIDLDSLLNTDDSLLPDIAKDKTHNVGLSEDIFGLKCDILIPAAVEKAITEEIAAHLDVIAVVPGANLAVTEKAEKILNDRGVVVLPDFLAGCGGSLSMEGLFGPEEHPEPAEVIQYVKEKMAILVKQVLEKSKREKVSPTNAALSICDEVELITGQKPYGNIS